MPLHKCSDKLIIGEQRNSQLIFPSVTQELKAQRAAPLRSVAISWFGFWKGDEARCYEYYGIISIVSSFGARPLIIPPSRVLRLASASLGIPPGPSPLCLSLGTVSIAADLVEAKEHEPARRPSTSRDPGLPQSTRLLPTPGCSQALSPSPGRELRGIFPVPRHVQTQPKVHLQPLPRNHSSRELASLENPLSFIYHMKEAVRVTVHFDMFMP